MVDRYDARPVRRSEEKGAGWGLAAALVLLALLLFVVSVRRQPPAPEAGDGNVADTASNVFPGVRARDTLRELIGDGSPHPLGTPAHDAVRDRVIARLRSYGYEPAVEKGNSCGPRSGKCGDIQNIVARLPGSQTTGTVLLMAHYDSVPTGPGAADDLTGTASVLEVARLLKSGPAPRNDVLFMLTDGEEAGLLGAAWFVDNSPYAKDVKAVVNLEARGTSGPSLLFETVGDNWTIPLYARRASHPTTSSVFATIYSLMPNDTDLSVFKKKQGSLVGVNFAFINDPLRYHTQGDSFENVSPASIQHHGDNALAAVRGMAEVDLAGQPHGQRTFFDVLGAFVVSWPLSWSLGLALLALVLVLAAAVLAVRRGTATGGGVALGFLAFLATLVLSGLVAFVLTMIVRGRFFVPNPFTLVAAYWLIPLALAGFIALALGRRSRATGLWAGSWLGWALLGLLLVVALPTPGISYLFVVPALVAAVTGLAAFGSRGVEGMGGTVAVLLTAAVAGVLWFPIVMPLYDGLGRGALLPIAVLVAIFLTAITPLFVTAPVWLRRGIPVAALVAAVILLIVQTATAPPPSPPRKAAEMRGAPSILSAALIG
jgi:hypothetical protein